MSGVKWIIVGLDLEGVRGNSENFLIFDIVRKGKRFVIENFEVLSESNWKNGNIFRIDKEIEEWI